MVLQYALTTANEHKGKISTKDLPRRYAKLLAFLYIYITCPSMSVYPVCANPVFMDATTTPEDDSTLKISELPFSEKLKNPCALVDASILQSSSLTEGNREHTKRAAISEMKAKTALLKENADTILKTNVLQDCTSLELPSLAVIPSTSDTQNNEPVQVLRLFYTSLLNHTAHVYFISEQLQRYSEDSSCYNPDLCTSTKYLASEMRELMCVLRVSTLALQPPDDDTDFFDDPTEQILNEQLADQPLCSRRSFRDCQTISSTLTLLQKLSDYLKDQVFDEDSESSSES